MSKFSLLGMASVMGLVLAAPNRRLVTDCTTGQGKRQYDQGVRLANSAFQSTWSLLGQDCAKLDELVGIMDGAAPTTPCCKNEGYLDAVYDKYSAAQEGCLSGCEGSGMQNKSYACILCVHVSWSAGDRRPG